LAIKQWFSYLSTQAGFPSSGYSQFEGLFLRWRNVEIATAFVVLNQWQIDDADLFKSQQPF